MRKLRILGITLVCFIAGSCTDHRKETSHDTDCTPLYPETAAYSTTISANNDPSDIYYPDIAQDDLKFPVAILLQGGRVDKAHYSQYSHKVAQYGFIVVVPNHQNVFEVPGYKTEGLFSELQQIPDVMSFMADENRRKDSPVNGYVDTTRLVLLGHSYGAATAIEAIQNRCEAPFCDEGATFTRPEQLKAVALCGINMVPKVGPQEVLKTFNQKMPIAMINGGLDSRVADPDGGCEITKLSYDLIQDPPKALVFIEGANHFGLCNTDNPTGPMAEINAPTIDQETAIEANARWSALFLRAHALGDNGALEYIYEHNNRDPNVRLFVTPAN